MNNKNFYIVLPNSSVYNVVLFNTNTLKALLLLHSSIFSKTTSIHFMKKATTSTLLVNTYFSYSPKVTALVNTFYSSSINFTVKGTALSSLVNTIITPFINFLKKVFTNRAKGTPYCKKSIPFYSTCTHKSKSLLSIYL